MKKMVHKLLENRYVLKHPFEYKSEPEAKAMIDKLCRLLVMTMRSIELDGLMDWFDIEKCVIACLGNAEYLYYGIPEAEFAQILEREVSNEQARRRSKSNL